MKELLENTLFSFTLITPSPIERLNNEELAT